MSKNISIMGNSQNKGSDFENENDKLKDKISKLNAEHAKWERLFGKQPAYTTMEDVRKIGGRLQKEAREQLEGRRKVLDEYAEQLAENHEKLKELFKKTGGRRFATEFAEIHEALIKIWVIKNDVFEQDEWQASLPTLKGSPILYPINSSDPSRQHPDEKVVWKITKI